MRTVSLLVVLVVGSAASAVDYAWNTTSSGNWNAAANWNPNTGTPGSASGDSAGIGLAGTYTVTLNINPANSLTAFTISNSNATFTASGRTFTVIGVSDLSAGLVNWGSSTWNSGTFDVGASTQFTATGTSAVNAAAISNAGIILVQAGASGSTLTINTGFTNSGTINLTTTGGGIPTLTVTSGTLTNAIGANINLQSGGSTNTRTIAVNLDNAGTPTVNVADGRINRNAGTHINSGTILVASGAKLSVTGTTSPTFTNQTSGILSGSGEIDMSASGLMFNNNGVTAPGSSAGILTFRGDYKQSSTGELRIELGGTTVGTQYDRLAVIGTAYIAGTLTVSYIGAFEPGPTDTFTILTNTGTRTGTFDVVTPGEYTFDITYNANDIVLSNFQVAPVPQPKTFAWLYGLIELAVARQRWKRRAAMR